MLPQQEKGEDCFSFKILWWRLACIDVSTSHSDNSAMLWCGVSYHRIQTEFHITILEFVLSRSSQVSYFCALEMASEKLIREASGLLNENAPSAGTERVDRREQVSL